MKEGVDSKKGNKGSEGKKEVLNETVANNAVYVAVGTTLCYRVAQSVL
jgi:hypothetical protein